MKKIVSLLLISLLLNVSLLAQTGQGVTLNLSSPTSFNPTTVDSTSQIDLIFTNSVNSSQIVTFSNLSNPFDIQGTLTLGASETDTIQMSFTPTSTGQFSDTLIWNADIFGSGLFEVNGEGVQVLLDVDNDTILFGSTPIGNSVDLGTNIYNNGTGTMNITQILSSNSDFSVSPNGANTLAQGGSLSLLITHAPSISGISNGFISVYSNDPNNPVYDIYVEGTGISEISGDLCGSLFANSSPFTLTGDININDSCVLYLEPGVTINGNGYNLYCAGKLIANGTSSDSIHFENFNRIDILDNDSLNYCSFNFSQSKFKSFYEDFSSNSYENYFNNLGPTYNQTYWYTHHYNNDELQLYACTNTSTAEIWTDPILVNGDRCIFSIDYRSEYLNSSNYFEVYYQKNTDGWVLAETINSSSGGFYGYQNRYKDGTLEIDFNALGVGGIIENGDNVSVKFLLKKVNNNCPSIYLDNMKINYLDDFNINLNPSISQPSVINNSYINYEKIDFDLSTLNVESFIGLTPSGWSTSYSGNSSFTNTYTTSNTRSPSYCWYQNLYYTGSVTLETKSFIASSGNNVFSSWIDFTYNQGYGEFKIDYKINNNSWVNMHSMNSTNSYTNKSFVFNNLNAGDLVKFRFTSTTSNNYDMTVYIDDVSFESFPENNRGVFINNSVISSDLHADVIDFSVYNSSFVGDNNLINEKLNFTNNLKNVELNNCSFLNYEADFNSGLDTIKIDSSNFDGKRLHYGALDYAEIKNSNFINSDTYGIWANAYQAGGQGCLSYFENINISNAASHGLHYIADNLCEIEINYSFFENNNRGISVSEYDINNGQSLVKLNYSSVSNNDLDGLVNHSRLFVNHCVFFENGREGIYDYGDFANYSNSIFWGNGYTQSFVQISKSGSYAKTLEYSSMQGLNSFGNGGIIIGDGAVSFDPLFSDSLHHLGSSSSCIDAGNIYQTDSLMPEGLGGPISDLGMYGGNGNWYWGGTPAIDGSALITFIDDTPLDQGGQVGITFDASVSDDFSLTNNVTEYAIWRHFDPNGNIIDSIDNGNWQLLGYTPAQNFNSYAYIAPTLADSNLVTGLFNSCYIVVAHTNNNAVYWNSNVLCGYSVDNLAPSSPIVSSMVDSVSQGVIVYWEAPQVSDYSYSSVFSLSGYSISGVTDTLALDISTVSGSTYTYGVIHFDVNGNSSDTAWTTISTFDNVDVIPLKSGWNLISTNHIPNNNNMIDIFSSLIPNNLVYVTSFNQGSSIYNPNGPTFLNTLNQFDNGYAYWVKVINDDTLRVTGATIDPSYKIPLNAGWNLSGYMSTISQSPDQYLGNLISNNNLVYCTSFNQGSSLFNPNGLPFLNTLNSMQRPFGYWIKVNTPVNSNQYRLEDNSGNKFSPYFMFVNGKSNLENFQGEYIDVLNSNGEVLNKIEILKGGYLMTTPLYGDDPATDFEEGFIENEELTFSFNGQKIIFDSNFKGNMELRELDLNFSNFGSLNIFPNPSSGVTNINFFTLKDADIKIHVFDVTGRNIYEAVNTNLDKGNHSTSWNASELDRGIYLIKLIVDGVLVSSERVVLQ
jgi:hypothetical protein